jgi:hypothetical protein
MTVNANTYEGNFFHWHGRAYDNYRVAIEEEVIKGSINLFKFKKKNELDVSKGAEPDSPY